MMFSSVSTSREKKSSLKSYGEEHSETNKEKCGWKFVSTSQDSLCGWVYTYIKKL